jgi:hypothetical protein
MSQVAEETPRTEEQPENALTPSYHVRVRYQKRIIFINVTLHKIPEHKINLNPTEQYFYLDTLSYSKRYWLKFPYPKDILVDAGKGTASMEHGTLKCTFPIIQIRDEMNGKLIKKSKKDIENDQKEKDTVSQDSNTKVETQKKKLVPKKKNGKTATQTLKPIPRKNNKRKVEDIQDPNQLKMIQFLRRAILK